MSAPPLEVDPQDVKRRLDSGEKLHLIDVREPHEFAQAKIEGATLIPMRSVPGELQDLEARADKGTLIGWNYLLDWASYRSKALARLVEPAPLLLIDHGRVLARNLRREFLTRDDLDAQLRLKGIASPSEVKKAYMESDGKFSVIRFDSRPSEDPASDDERLPGAG